MPDLPLPERLIYASTYDDIYHQVIRERLGYQGLIERASEDDDKKKATDFNLSEMGISVACRLRTPQSFKYNDLTIRENNSSRTELNKIKDNLNLKYYIYLWESSKRVIGKGLILDLDLFRASALIEQGILKERFSQNSFRYWDVRDLRDEGLLVAEWGFENGD